ncbi:hypothetical protein QE152_g4209 [Popillia japonica]|uniref:Uncharacterized protein n=1 Tax=Popillia japonica TaxID=7064 RepID=A0AAW1N018_POPJA
MRSIHSVYQFNVAQLGVNLKVCRLFIGNVFSKMSDRSKKVIRGPPLHVPLPEGSLGQILRERMLRYGGNVAFVCLLC